MVYSSLQFWVPAHIHMYTHTYIHAHVYMYTIDTTCNMNCKKIRSNFSQNKSESIAIKTQAKRLQRLREHHHDNVLDAKVEKSVEVIRKMEVSLEICKDWCTKLCPVSQLETKSSKVGSLTAIVDKPHSSLQSCMNGKRIHWTSLQRLKVLLLP